jgi:hypothetical protein
MQHEVTNTFEVLTAVSVKISAFWVVTLCSAESLTFHRNVLPPSSCEKSTSSKIAAETAVKLLIAHGD